MPFVSTEAAGSAAVNALAAPGGPFELHTLAVDGVPCRVFLRGPQTLSDIYGSLAEFAPRTLCVCGERRLTYSDLLGQAAALARTLAMAGLGRGSRIAIAMHNRPEWLIAFIAITSLGGVAVLVNSRGTAAEIDAALRGADAEALLADTERAALVAENGFSGPLLMVDDASQPPFGTAVDGWQSAELSAAQLQPDDEAIIMFTSGTTGGSKAVLLTQRAVMTGIMNIQYSMAVIGARIQALQVAADDSFAARQSSSLLAVPLFHSSGCFSVFLSNLLRGGKVVILPKWNAERALALIEEEQIMAFSGAPTMLWDLLRQDRSGRDLNCLLSLGVGGQALQPHLLREIVAAFPRAMLGGGYGMTESSGSVCLIAGEDLIQRPTSSGHVLAAADLRLVDEQGVEVDAGAVGEICLRGAMVMRGYCKRPNDTAAVLRDGWLHTGDLGRLDAEGYLYVIDRKKDIVISGGENISCTEVEGAAMEHPALLEAAAFGVVDERLGEMLVMAIVPKADHAIDDRVLKEHVAQRLAIYKVPRAVMVCAVLPRNALGKVNRNELRERFLARISQDA